MKFHHVGIASTDINKTRESIKKLHNVVDDSGIVFDELQNASLCLLTLQDGTRLEIVAGHAVESYCKKNMTYYHICYEVGDLKRSIDDLMANGAMLVSSPKPAKLFNMKKVAFLYTTYGIIELLERG
tara:strand:+ start:41 stop:421 length:381 start_codon:yes stop_codon:yes gene_type:complete